MPLQVIGTCNGGGKIVLKDPEAPPEAPTPVDLDLKTVLGDLPQKTYEFPEFSVPWEQPLTLPDGETTMDSLEKVLRLPSVCSKRFLTTKVDRCVTGEPLASQSPFPKCCSCVQLHASHFNVEEDDNLITPWVW
jgi:phosphoribosylformylglycinamidine synthase